MDQVHDTFLREDFATLEATAADLRARKDRFPDGVWTLPAFYDALEVEHFTRSDFETRLPKWKAAQPASVAVRLVEALAIQSDLSLHPATDPATEMPHPLSARALLDEAEKLTPAPRRIGTTP